MFAIVRFASDKTIHTYTIENVYEARHLLTMDKVVWMQVITDTGMVIQPKADDQSKLDKESYSRPLRPRDAYLPSADRKAENALDAANHDKEDEYWANQDDDPYSYDTSQYDRYLD